MFFACLVDVMGVVILFHTRFCVYLIFYFFYHCIMDVID